MLVINYYLIQRDVFVFCKLFYVVRYTYDIFFFLFEGNASGDHQLYYLIRAVYKQREPCDFHNNYNILFCCISPTRYFYRSHFEIVFAYFVSSVVFFFSNTLLMRTQFPVAIMCFFENVFKSTILYIRIININRVNY